MSEPEAPGADFPTLGTTWEYRAAQLSAEGDRIMRAAERIERATYYRTDPTWTDFYASKRATADDEDSGRSHTLTLLILGMIIGLIVASIIEDRKDKPGLPKVFE